MEANENKYLIEFWGQQDGSVSKWTGRQNWPPEFSL